MPDTLPEPRPRPAPLDYSGTPPTPQRERTILVVIASALFYTLLSGWFIHHLIADGRENRLFYACILAILLPFTALYLLVCLVHLLTTKKVRLRRMERLYNRLDALYSTPPTTPPPTSPSSRASPSADTAP